MKVAAIILLLCISSAFAMRNRNAHRQISVHNLQLEKISTLGSALKGFIQLADAADYDEVVEVLNDVRTDLNDILDTQRNQLSEATATYEEQKSTLEDRIEETEAEISNNEVALESAEQARDSLESAVSDYTAQADQTQQAIDNENDRRAQQHADYQQQESDINDAIAVVAEARSMLDSVMGADVGTLGVTFIQTQKKRFNKQLSLIQSKVSNLMMRTSTSEVYMRQLVQIAQDAETNENVDTNTLADDNADTSSNTQAQGTVNTELLSQIYSVLDSFEASLREESNQVQERDQEDAETSQASLDALNTLLQSLLTELAKNQSDLDNTEATIANLEAEASRLDNVLSQAQNVLARVEADFEQQSETLNNYITELEKDLEVLDRAINFVQSQAAEEANYGVDVDVSAQGSAGVEAQ